MPALETIVFQIGHYGPFVLVVVSIFLLAEVVFLSFLRRSRSSRRINTRLAIRDRNEDLAAAAEELRQTRGLNGRTRGPTYFGGLHKFLLQAGISIPPGKLVGFLGAAGAATTVLGVIIFDSVLVALLLAIAIGGIIPALILLMLRKRRLARFTEQLPEAIDVMVRSLRAGHPMTVAIGMVANEMRDPIGSDFGVVADEMTYGLDLETALANLRDRTGLTELSFLVVATSIQARSRGNLAEILSKLARMVRERARMRRKILSLSSEGRWSALLLSLLPLALFLLFSTLSPGFYGEVRNDVIFMPVVVLGILLWAVGIVVLYKMVNFKT